MTLKYRVATVSLGLACSLTVIFYLKLSGPLFEGVHGVVVEAQARTTSHREALLGQCPMFPVDNVWNTPIDHLPLNPRAELYVRSIGPLHTVHPDFGSNLSTGIPYSEMPTGTKSVKMTFDYREDSDLGNYPVPVDAPIEGGSYATGDRHILLVDPRRCILYEIYDAHPQADGSWKAGSGIKMDLTGNALRAEGKTSADAAGLPILPGLVRYDEVAAGEIRHALRFTIPHTQSAFIWPARHMASKNGDASLPPMGTRFRLRSDFDITSYSAKNQVILICLKRYGMFLADNGGALFVSGVSDRRWEDRDLRKLSAVRAEDFEAVDESGLQMLGDSARVDPLAVEVIPSKFR